MAILLKKRTTITSFQMNKQLNQQGLFLNRLGRLLQDGFSLKEALAFLKTIMPDQAKSWIAIIEDEVRKGKEFSKVMKEVGFPEQTCAQIYFSMYHGQFAQSAIRAGDHLIKQGEKRKQLRSIIQYPLMLIFFIVAMLFAMRYILLPHIEQITAADTNQLPFSTQFIVQSVYNAPIILIALLLILIIVVVVAKQLLKQKTPLEKLMTISSFLNHSLFKLYWTQFFAYEWGNLLKGKRSLLEVVEIMKENDASKLVNEMGGWIEKEMKRGQSFHEALFPLTFLNKEVIEIVKHGEISGKLGLELEMYAQNCEEEFDKKTIKTMEWIQPIVFVIVAIMIVAIYAALLLPTFSLMDTL